MQGLPTQCRQGSLYNDSGWVCRGCAENILLLFVSHSPGSKSAGTFEDMPLSNPDGMVDVLAVVSCPVCSQQLSFQFTAQLDAQPPVLFSLHCIMSIPSHT